MRRAKIEKVYLGSLEKIPDSLVANKASRLGKA